jgi:hypothetical protein
MTRLERFGAGMSLACAIHCAATPLPLSALPLLGERFAKAHWVEALVILLVASIGYFSLGLSFRRHGRSLPLVLFTTGLGIFVLAHTPLLSGVSTAFAIAGALTLATAQLWNRRYAPSCCGGHGGPHDHHHHGELIDPAELLAGSR